MKKTKKKKLTIFSRVPWSRVKIVDENIERGWIEIELKEGC